MLLEYPWESDQLIVLVLSIIKGLYIYLVVCYVYLFQVKNIVKYCFLHLQEHHQMLCSTFLWDYQHLYPQVSLLVELMLSMLASSAVVERGIKMCLLLYATFLQLGMITLPMQKSVKNLILSSLVRVFFQALCFNWGKFISWAKFGICIFVIFPFSDSFHVGGNLVSQPFHAEYKSYFTISWAFKQYGVLMSGKTGSSCLVSLGINRLHHLMNDQKWNAAFLPSFHFWMDCIMD